MKTLITPTIYYSFLEDCTYSDLVNGYFGGSNLLASYLNDFSSKAVNRRLAEFLEENAAELCSDGIEDILNDPDGLIREAAVTFYDALVQLSLGDADRSEYVLKHSEKYFDSWGDYYLYANMDAACIYIIRAQNDYEAYEWLVTEFEKAFAVDEDDASEDTPRNDNGTPINTDYLVMLGSIKFVKPSKEIDESKEP